MAITELDGLAQALSLFDPTDIASGVGALHLMPDNASRQYRLGLAADIVATLPQGVRPIMSPKRWHQFMNASWLSSDFLCRQEDPVESLFTEAMTFHGGSYVVFPGIIGDATFIARHMAKAIFQASPLFGPPDYRRECLNVFWAALALGDEVARRAGLGRWLTVTETPRMPVALPHAKRFEQLKRAVTFTAQEITALLTGSDLSTEALEPLCLEQGSVALEKMDPEEGPTIARPILRTNGHYVVLVPGALLVAARHQLVLLAAKYDLSSELADRYRWMVFDTVVESLKNLECPPLSISPIVRQDVPLISAVHSLDKDKVIHVVLTTDSLEDYDSARAIGEWDNPQFAEDLESRMLEVEEFLFSLSQRPNEVLHLVVSQSVGRFAVVGIGSRLESVRSYRLLMRAQELETVALLEMGKPLVLWQFAQASERLHEQAKVISYSILDEYCQWRRQRYSYYFSDNQRQPALIMFEIGMGRELVEEVATKRDFHGATSFIPNSVVEVTLIHDDRSIPVYTPADRSAESLSLLVEGLGLPVWVVGPAEIAKPYQSLYVLFADMVTYWLWQLSTSLKTALQTVAAVCELIRIDLLLIEDESWFRTEDNPGDGAFMSCSISPAGVMTLTLQWGVAHELNRPDNVGERSIMLAIVKSILQWADELAGKTSIEADVELRTLQILNKHAPIGPKKKVLFTKLEADARLREEGLPLFRKVQEFNEEVLLDELGVHLVRELHLPQGPIPNPDRTGVLERVVDFFFVKLQRLVASLNPSGLVEWLVAFNERLVYEGALQRLTIPTRLECYSTVPKMVLKLTQEIPDIHKAAMASRFLIEYVAAQPPQGLRPISLAVYDEMLALASHVINWALTSDLIRLDLADLPVSILASGRIGVSRDAFERARMQFLLQHATAEIDRTSESFSRYWRQSEGDVPFNDQLDKATEVEFGLPLSDLLLFLGTAADVGDNQGSEPLLARFDALCAEVCVRLSWDMDKVEKAADFFTLYPRQEFLSPPQPYHPREVYPWLFNRALSYVRKPLLQRPGQDGKTEILWGSRHSYAAGLYLIDLCMGGRLKARTHPMKKFVSEIQNQASEAFNDKVAELYEAHPNLVVRRRIDRFGGLTIQRLNGDVLGDIDVLVADPKRRKLLAVEAKDLLMARTPAEMANEIKNTFQGRDGKLCAADRHRERTAWLRSHIAEVLKHLNILDDQPRRWSVDPWIVIDQELMSPYLAKSPVPVITYRELRDKLRT